MGKSVCFDVIGTCFEFSTVIKAIDTELHDTLASHKVDAKSLFFSWFYAAQRDFTYCSIVDAYVPIATILKDTFKRACLIIDLPPHAVTDSCVSNIMKEFKGMQARQGLKACVDGLRGAGWDVYAVTNGGQETSLGYFKQADIALDGAHCLSCDTLGKAKPDVAVYRNASDKVVAADRGSADGTGAGSHEKWFVAAHSWDLIAARKAGFKTAYIDFEEHDPVTSVFGEFDLYASTMEDLLTRMHALE